MLQQRGRLIRLEPEARAKQRFDRRKFRQVVFTSSLTSSLLGNLSLVNIIGLGLPIPGPGTAVAGILAGVTSPVDQLLASPLQTLGVGIGRPTSGPPGCVATALSDSPMFDSCRWLS